MSSNSQRPVAASDATRAAPSPDIKRRRFLFALGAGGAGAAAVAARSLTAPVVPAAVATTADGPKGYRETEHIRDYYATTRI